MSAETDPRVARLRRALREDADPLTEGSEIGGSLRLCRSLAEGGMGRVWIADHIALRTQVAVKFMRERGSTDPQALERFGREATAAARIRSPHVVAIHDHGVAFDDTPYIVMELLEGRDLRRVLEERRITPTETVAIASQTAKALAKAHSLGIIHRDVKPANVFLCDEGGQLLVKLLDFGVAKRAGDGLASTASGSTLGTPLYMSPEQVVDAKTVDARADVWSLAVVAYECLTGALPFQGDSVGAVAIAIHRGKFVAPSELVPGLPPAVDALFERAFAAGADSRFPGVQELADALSDALGIPRAMPVSAEIARATDASASAGAATTLSGASATPPRPPAGDVPGADGERTRAVRRRYVGGAVALIGMAALFGSAWPRSGSTDAQRLAPALALLPERTAGVVLSETEGELALEPAPPSPPSATAPADDGDSAARPRVASPVVTRKPAARVSAAPTTPLAEQPAPTADPGSAPPAPKRRDRGF